MKEGSTKGDKESFHLKLVEDPPPDMMSIMAIVFGLMGLLLKVCFVFIIFI